jgi:phosphatidylglycerophosphatase A
MNTFRRTAVLFVSQGAYSGRFPVAPGTAGTLIGVLLYWPMATLSPAWYGFLLVFFVSIGIWSAGQAETLIGRKDSPTIVIDEIAGYLVAMFMAPDGWHSALAGFLLFRFFDIIKPFPLRRVEKIGGGTGIMLDDIGAGVYTNIVLQVLHRIL